MEDFEKDIERTLPDYDAAGVATLEFRHPPMRVAGLMGKMPCHVRVGKGPYDVGGFYHGCAKAIGVELKHSSAHEHSLPIIGEGKKGTGLQWHQLQLLVQLHREGGVAGLLWNNAGEIGWVGGDALLLALLQYETALKQIASKRLPAKGSKSIPWGHFKPVKLGHADKPLWLPPSPC